MISLSRRVGATVLGFFSLRPKPQRVTLSAVLQRQVSPKYCLSPKAARGILRRAEKRGRALPAALQSALTHLALEGDSQEVQPR